MTDATPLRVLVQDGPEHLCLTKIASGAKRYEGRLACKVQAWKLELGKCIVFHCDGKEVPCVVTELLFFQDFGEAYDTLGELLMPGMTRKTVVEMYNSFWAQPGERCDEHHPCLAIRLEGVVCIGLRVVRE